MTTVAQLVASIRADISDFVTGMNTVQGWLRNLVSTTTAAGLASGNGLTTPFIRAFGVIGNGLASVSRGMNAFSKSVIASGNSFNYLAFVATAVLTQAATSVGKLAFEFTLLETRAKRAFTQMMGDSKKANQMLKELEDFAIPTPFETPDLINHAQRLIQLKVAYQDIIPSIKSVGDYVTYFGKAGTSATENIKGIFNALSAMLTKGTVGLREIQARLGSFGVTAMKLLAQQQGVTTKAMSKMVKEGIVPAKWAFEALVYQMEKAAPNAMVKGAQDMDTATSGLRDMVRRILGGSKELGGAGLAIPLYKDFISAIVMASNKLGELNEKLKSLSEETKRRFSYLLVSVTALAPAVLAFQGLIRVFQMLATPMGVFGAALSSVIYYLTQNKVAAGQLHAMLNEMGSILMKISYEGMDIFKISGQAMWEVIRAGFPVIRFVLELFRDLISAFSRLSPAVQKTILIFGFLATIYSPLSNQLKGVGNAFIFVAEAMLKVVAANAGLTAMIPLPKAMTAALAGMTPLSPTGQSIFNPVSALSVATKSSVVSTPIAAVASVARKVVRDGSPIPFTFGTFTNNIPDQFGFRASSKNKSVAELTLAQLKDEILVVSSRSDKNYRSQKASEGLYQRLGSGMFWGKNQPLLGTYDSAYDLAARGAGFGFPASIRDPSGKTVSYTNAMKRLSLGGVENKMSVESFAKIPLKSQSNILQEVLGTIGIFGRGDGAKKIFASTFAGIGQNAGENLLKSSSSMANSGVDVIFRTTNLFSRISESLKSGSKTLSDSSLSVSSNLKKLFSLIGSETVDGVGVLGNFLKNSPGKLAGYYRDNTPRSSVTSEASAWAKTLELKSAKADKALNYIDAFAGGNMTIRGADLAYSSRRKNALGRDSATQLSAGVQGIGEFAGNIGLSAIEGIKNGFRAVESAAIAAGRAVGGVLVSGLKAAEVGIMSLLTALTRSVVIGFYRFTFAMQDAYAATVRFVAGGLASASATLSAFGASVAARAALAIEELALSFQAATVSAITFSSQMNFANFSTAAVVLGKNLKNGVIAAFAMMKGFSFQNTWAGITAGFNSIIARVGALTTASVASSAATGAAAATAGQAATVAGGPLVWLVAALVAAAALIWLAWENNFGHIQEFTAETWKWVVAIWRGVVISYEMGFRELAMLWEETVSGFKGGWAGFIAFFQNIGATISGWWKTFTDGIEGAKNSSNIFIKMFGSVVSLLEKVNWREMFAPLMDIWEFLANKASLVGKAIGGVVGSVVGPIGGIIANEKKKIDREQSENYFMGDSNGRKDVTFAGYSIRNNIMDKYAKEIVEQSQKHGIDPKIVQAILNNENSGMNPSLIGNNTNGTKDFGLMQINSATLRERFHTDPKTYEAQKSYLNTAQNIEMGIIEFQGKFKDAHGDLQDAFRRYNGSGKKANAYGKKAMDFYSSIGGVNPEGGITSAAMNYNARNPGAFDSNSASLDKDKKKYDAWILAHKKTIGSFNEDMTKSSTEYAKALFDVTEGWAKRLSPAQKNYMLSLAQVIDKHKQASEVAKLYAKDLKTVQDKRSAAVGDIVDSGMATESAKARATMMNLSGVSSFNKSQAKTYKTEVDITVEAIRQKSVHEGINKILAERLLLTTPLGLRPVIEKAGVERWKEMNPAEQNLAVKEYRGVEIAKMNQLISKSMSEAVVEFRTFNDESKKNAINLSGGLDKWKLFPDYIRNTITAFESLKGVLTGLSSMKMEWATKLKEATNPIRTNAQYAADAISTLMKKYNAVDNLATEKVTVPFLPEEDGKLLGYSKSMIDLMNIGSPVVEKFKNAINGITPGELNKTVLNINQNAKLVDLTLARKQIVDWGQQFYRTSQDIREKLAGTFDDTSSKVLAWTHDNKDALKVLQLSLEGTSLGGENWKKTLEDITAELANSIDAEERYTTVMGQRKTLVESIHALGIANTTGGYAAYLESQKVFDEKSKGGSMKVPEGFNTTLARTTYESNLLLGSMNVVKEKYISLVRVFADSSATNPFDKWMNAFKVINEQGTGLELPMNMRSKEIKDYLTSMYQYEQQISGVNKVSEDVTNSLFSALGKGSASNSELFSKQTSLRTDILKWKSNVMNASNEGDLRYAQSELTRLSNDMNKVHQKMRNGWLETAKTIGRSLYTEISKSLFAVVSEGLKEKMSQGLKSILTKLFVMPKSPKDLATDGINAANAALRTSIMQNSDNEAFNTTALNGLHTGFSTLDISVNSLTSAITSLTAAMMVSSGAKIGKSVEGFVSSILDSPKNTGVSGFTLGTDYQAPINAGDYSGAAAEGGMKAPGDYLVGEYGPEVVKIGSRSRIVTNSELKENLSSRKNGGGDTIHFHLPVSRYQDTASIKKTVPQAMTEGYAQLERIRRRNG